MVEARASYHGPGAAIAGRAHPPAREACGRRSGGPVHQMRRAVPRWALQPCSAPRSALSGQATQIIDIDLAIASGVCMPGECGPQARCLVAVAHHAGVVGPGFEAPNVHASPSGGAPYRVGHRFLVSIFTSEE